MLQWAFYLIRFDVDAIAKWYNFVLGYKYTVLRGIGNQVLKDN